MIIFLFKLYPLNFVLNFINYYAYFSFSSTKVNNFMIIKAELSKNLSRVNDV